MKLKKQLIAMLKHRLKLLKAKAYPSLLGTKYVVSTDEIASRYGNMIIYISDKDKIRDVRFSPRE